VLQRLPNPIIAWNPFVRPAPQGLLAPIWRVAFLLFIWTVLFSSTARAGEIDAEAQEKVVKLLQEVIQNYWNGGSGRTNVANHTGIDTNVEAAFRAASALMPERLDLRFGIASALMGQAVQTNGSQLELKVKEAMEVYRQIQVLDTNSFAAPILYAAYTRAVGQTNESTAAIQHLLEVHPQRTREYIEKFRQADRVLDLVPSEKIQRQIPQDTKHAIVILGAGLETNGTIKAKLVSRLSQGLKLARLYAGAPIILTGGNQKDGVTEAYAMSRWLVQHRIPRRRLILEDKAKDTVENAIFSSAILQRLGVSRVTLVTSANHVRRGLVDLQEACLQRGLALEFYPLAARAKTDTNLDPEQERVGVYRDLMRTSGLWAYPGMQR
jgi:hypothetical protein